MPKLTQWFNQAVVERVIDGDTFTCSIILGFGLTLWSVVRIRGYDAPEVNGVHIAEAGRCRSLLLSLLPPGKKIVLCHTFHDRDKYGRVLAYVLMPGNVDIVTLLPQEYRTTRRGRPRKNIFHR